jgi:LysR family transcriptional regulator, hydrogen peroxide-inducible genes activator
MISITQIEYILAVHRFRHFAKASHHCGVSQPSLSLQIQKVEEFLGYPIFDRDKKPVELSSKGTRFVEQANIVLSEHKRLISQSLSEQGVVRGEFNLGVIPTIMPFLVPLIIADFSQKFPEVILKIHELNTELCVQGLRLHNIDGAILATPLSEKGIRERALYYESFFLYAHANDPILKKKSLEAKDINPNDLWLLKDGHCFKNQVLNFCQIDGSMTSLRNINLLGGSLEVLRQVVMGSWGYTLIPEMMKNSLSKSEQENQVRPFSHQNPLREISLVYAREQWKSDILNALEACILRCLPKSIQRKVPAKSTVLDIN